MKNLIYMQPVIPFEGINDEFKLSPNDFAFLYQEERTTGYFWLNTDEDAIPDLEAEIQMEEEYAAAHGYEVDEDHRQRFLNDIKLITALQELGYNQGALIYIWS